jgi:hypothetical protein
MGRRNPRHAGPGAGGAEIPAAGCTAVAEGKGEEADRWAPVGRERKGEGRTWAGLAVRERGEREELGLGRSWASGQRVLGCFLSLFFSFFLFHTQTIQTIPFEFK